MYQALYRKWRPKTFSEVVGQEHITETLRHQVAEGRVGHAYLFTGTRGTGKTTCARILAKAVNCLDPIDGAPCCQCAACRAIDEGTTLDVTELDAASNNGVDQVRALREEAIYTPSTLKKRIYIIDEVHMLSSAAFNALLKILEEPPEHLMFILATTELHKVLPTILSRCQRFTFKRILPRDMEAQLLKIAQAENIDLSADGAELLSHMAGGALRDALSLLDQCRVAEGTLDRQAILDVLGLAGSVQTLQMMRCILSENTGDVLTLFDQLYRAGKSESALLGELSDLVRDVTVMKAAPEGGDALLSGSYDRKTLEELGHNIPMRRFLYLTSTLQSANASLSLSPRPRTEAELCLIKCCDESLSGDLDGLCARIEKLEDAVKNGVTVKAAPTVKAPPAASAPPKTAPAEPIRETPPLPEEAPPVESEPPAPKPAPAPTVSGDGDLWGQLLDHYKGRLPVQYRVFLNMATGVFQDDTLTVLCQNDFVKDSLDNQSVLSVLREVTTAELGRPVTVTLTVGSAPRKPVGSKPTGSAPAEAPASGSHDALDDLMNKGMNLENFKIK